MMQFLGKCSRNWFWGFAIIIGLVFCPSLWAANIYVAPNGTGDGSTTLTPASLQDALNAANSASGNHILFLQQGQYNASDVSGFKVTVANNTTEKSITLSGGWTTDYTGQYTDPETTRLDGVNTTRVLDLFADGGTAYINFHVENVTIQNGYVLGGSGAGIQADISSTNGGLLKLYVHLCLIRNNAARYNAGGGFGGGLYATGYVEVSNTTFESNSSGYHGGAIMFTYRAPYTDTTVAPKVDNCIFLNNFNPAGACCPNGSAIANSVNLTVTNSRFEGQTGSGSPIHSFSGSYLSVSHSFFYNNKIDYWGSAIQFWDSGGEIKNSVFMQNNTGWNNRDGYGAVTYYNANGSAENITISNCTFLGNRSLTGGTGLGGALHNRGANLTIANSIFWDNGTYGIYSESGNATISYSDVQGGLTFIGFTDGGNNITDDPGFAPGAYHLPPGSPCVDKGSNAAAAGILTDIDGDLRIINGTVDMGADEVVAPPSTPSEGTVGTEITVIGNGFGDAKGKVLIGTVAAKVTSWTNTRITATVKKVPLPIGPYDVSITTKAKETFPFDDAFTVKNPELDTLADNAGRPEDKIIVTGNFFGSKKGKVYLEDLSSGKKKSCKVTYWYMNPTTGASEIWFLVPKLSKSFTAGAYPLRVENKIGFAIASEDFTILP
jgi:predicted outer membrane repeat protein